MTIMYACDETPRKGVTHFIYNIGQNIVIKLKRIRFF